jgi:parallel beta-helix repeat protein
MLFRKCLLVTMFILMAGILLASSEQAFAGPKITVGNCKNAQYSTIQAAVNAAAPGSDIVVCAGTYVEQITIPTGKDNLTLRSDQPLTAIIKAPAVLTGGKAIVDVAGAHNVTIRGFTITGPGGGGCDSIRYGIRVDMGGSAAIRENHLTDIHDEPFSGCQNGIGIGVGRDSEGQTGSATIQKNTIDDYQKDGIIVSNVGSSADIRDNTISGVGPTAIIAQNGIQVAGGATANVQHNDVSQNIYSPQTVVATGILLFNPGSVTVDHNEASSNDVNIYAFHSANPVVITHNKVSGGLFDGMDVVATTGADVSHNTSLNNAMDGIFVDDTSSGNSITHNKMSGNGLYDAEDDSTGAGTCGTANFWDHNDCSSDNLGGCLCSQGGGGNAGADDQANFRAAQRPSAPANSSSGSARIPSP